MMTQQVKTSLAFFVYPVLRFPRNNRQYYLAKELLARGWRVVWLLPESGINEGVPVEEHILRYRDLDVRGRTYLLPIYLGLMLRARGIKYLWLSGWSITAVIEIYWLIRILRLFKIETIYDTIDPICEFKVANKELTAPEEINKLKNKMNTIYCMCRKVLCVTPEMKSLLVLNGADATKLTTARWGADAKVFEKNVITGDFRKRMNICDSAVLVGWLGSMMEFKGLHEMLLPLIERFLKDKNIHFLLAGDGPLFGMVQEWVKSLDHPSVSLIGRLSYHQAAQFTASLDAYVVTTDPVSEYARAICPVKCYDALAAGTPLVTTRTPATEHLSLLSGNVFLCDYKIDSFERAVRHIVANIETIKASRAGVDSGMITHQAVSKDIADMLAGLSFNQD